MGVLRCSWIGCVWVIVDWGCWGYGGLGDLGLYGLRVVGLCWIGDVTIMMD